MRRALLSLGVLLLMGLPVSLSAGSPTTSGAGEPVSSAAGSATASGTELPTTVCDKANKKLKKAKKKLKKAKSTSAKKKAKKKAKKAKKKVGRQCLKVTSSAFKNGKAIPVQYTCTGLGISPPLAWKGAKASAAGLPKGTTELALLVEDADAPSGIFVHWVLYGIAPGTTSIAENSVPPGATQGLNDIGDRKYFEPCPPQGDGPHRYFFTVFALSSPLGLGPGTTATQVRSAADGKTKATGQLLGTYER